jgi:hypothetical protein
MKKGVAVFVVVLVGAAIWWLTALRSEQPATAVKTVPAAEAGSDFASSREGSCGLICVGPA